MNILGICPTYNRPHLVPNVLAMWQQQECENQRHLLIFDDAGQFKQATGEDWTLASTASRFKTLGAKFAATVDFAMRIASAKSWDLEGTAIALFEDDDVYLPKYLAAHAATLRNSQFSAPHRVLANDEVGPGKWHSVDARGRHHGAWAYSLRAYIQSGGYADENPGFDLAFGGRLAKIATPANTNSAGFGPTYIYRWMTASKNGSAFGDSLLDSQPSPDGRVIEHVEARMDAETSAYYREFTRPSSPSCCTR